MSRDASLQLVTLGFAGCDADHRVREVGGDNKGPRIRQYLANADPPLPEGLAWCAVAVQYWSDAAARLLGVVNPLDAVRAEGLVQSYFDYLRANQVEAADAVEGDLVLFKFGTSERAWDHMGLLAQRPRPGSTTFWTVEGNTSSENQRDGDAVAVKPRDLAASYPVCFIAWAREIGD